MLKLLRAGVVLLAVLTVVTGVIYPLVVTAIAQVVFPYQANGSLIVEDQKVVGSSLIGQSFTEPQYFWGRLSATPDVAYNAGASSGSNLGPSNPQLRMAVQERLKSLGAKPSGTAVPVDLVTASGSGLDPHISPAAAEMQLARVAAHRKISEDDLRALVLEQTEARQLGLLGEPRVNVLQLNLALDRRFPQ
jgi:K+-transporting ATPase ATPase C chain